MKTKEELQEITCEISKDLAKYKLSFPEMTVALCWILSTIGQRIKEHSE